MLVQLGDVYPCESIAIFSQTNNRANDINIKYCLIVLTSWFLRYQYFNLCHSCDYIYNER